MRISYASLFPIANPKPRPRKVVGNYYPIGGFEVHRALSSLAAVRWCSFDSATSIADVDGIGNDGLEMASNLQPPGVLATGI